MANAVGNLLVRIGADTRELQRELRKSETGLEKLGKVGKTAGTALVAALAAAGAAVAAMSVKGVKLGDDMAKAARSVGVTVEALAGLRHAASLAGVENQVLDKAVQRLGKSLGDAKQGLSTAQRAFEDLGLRWQELEKLPLDEQMLLVGERLRGVTAQTDRLRISQDILGRGSARLLGLFDQGTDAIRAQMSEVKALGTYLDTTQTRVVEEAADAQDRMRASFDGLAIQLGATFGPAIEAGANLITKLTGRVIALLPKLAALAERFLGIKRSVEDLGETEIQAKLRDLTTEWVELSATIRDLETAAAGSRGKQRLGAEERITQEKQRQADITAEIARLEGELQRRADNPALPGPAEIDEDSINVTARGNQGPTSADLQPVSVRVKPLVDENIERLRLLQERIKTEEQLIVEQYNRDVELLRGALALERLTQEEHDAALKILAEQTQSELTRIAQEGATERQRFEEMTNAQKVANVVGTLQQMTAGVATHNKKLFNLNKLAGVANAVVNTAQGVTKALASYPPPISFAMAAAQAAAGAAQISAIKSTTFEGGGRGTTPSSAGSTPTVNDQPAQEQRGTPTLINIQGSGDTFSRDQVRSLIEQINEAVGDGAKVTFK